jgi:hypothetical protein
MKTPRILKEIDGVGVSFRLPHLAVYPVCS